MERTVMRLKCFWEYNVVNFDLKHRHFNILQINLHKNIILKHWNELKQINTSCWWYNYKDKKPFWQVSEYIFYTFLKVMIANKEI